MQKTEALQALLESFAANKDEILALLKQHSPLFKRAPEAFVGEEWLNAISGLISGRGPGLYRWAAMYADALRRNELSLSEILDSLRKTRKELMVLTRERLTSLSELDLHLAFAELTDATAEQFCRAYAESEEKSAASARRVQSVVAGMVERPFALLDNEGRIVVANGSLARLTGVSEDALPETLFPDLCAKETSVELKRELKHRRGGPRTFEGALLEGRSGRPRGVAIPLAFSLSPLFDQDGFRNGLAVAMVDAQSSLAAMNESFQLRAIEFIAEALGKPFYVVDRAGLICSASHSAASFVNEGDNDRAAECCRQHVGSDGECGHCFDKRVFETGEPYRAVTQFRMCSGEVRWVELSCIPLYGENGQVVRVAKLLSDVSEQKLLEEQFLRQQRTSLMSQLAITVAHQLRNPLGVMVGFAEMLSQGLPAEQVPSVIDAIMRNGVRCKDIVENLLEFGRGTPGEYRPFNVNEVLLEQVKPTYQTSVADRIEWHLAEGLPFVEGAPEQMGIVFTCLIDNALQAGAHVWVETSSNGREVLVSVRDVGAGVAPEYRTRIFEPFFTTHKETGGVGLGLSLSRSVVQEHRGSLVLEPSDSGALFALRLPARDSATAPRPASVQGEPAPASGRRVLIIEDETDLVFLLTLALEARGYQVDTAVTGAHAMELVQQKAYSAAVIDMLLLDELGGRELYPLLQRSHPELAARTLFITGDTMKYETRRFLTEAKRPYLEKPFLISDFMTILEKIAEG